MRGADPFKELAGLGRDRCLHLGCGPHVLPPPWENFDSEVDIGRPLPFPDLSAAYILAEHVIEHVPFVAGLHFLKQCRRVLQEGGVLRLAFPDVTRFDEVNTPLYLEFLQSLNSMQALAGGRQPTLTVGDAYRFVLEGSGHLACWSEASGACALFAAGFSDVVVSSYGRSAHGALDGIDGHHLTSSLTAATIETTVLEATK